MPSRGVLQVVGFVFLAIGALEFLLIWALRDGSNAAPDHHHILLARPGARGTAHPPPHPARSDGGASASTATWRT
jgi:hypothetical protein